MAVTVTYDLTPPAASDPRDVKRTIAATAVPQPDLIVLLGGGKVRVGYAVALSGAQQTTLQNAVAATAADPTAPWNIAATLTARAQTALTANATYQAIGAPSVAQNTAQIQSLTKQCNGIIRLLLGQLDSTTGT